MKMTEGIKQWIRRTLTAPGEELGRAARMVQFQIQLWRQCARRLRANNAMAMSSALSFRTIFALVPVLVLMLTILNSIGALTEGKQSLRDLLEASGLGQITISSGRDDATTQPATQPAETLSLADKIEEVVATVESKLTLGRIGPIGAVVLIWSAVTLLTTIERSLNRIFGAPRSRSLGRRLLLYWSAVTLGPLALTVTVYLFEKAEHAVADTPGIAWLLAAANWAAPSVVGIVLLAALYKLMPNMKVRYRAAVGGAIVVVPLWMLAKWGFALYVTDVVGAGSLYGAIGLLPLFLVWLNLSWLIFLFGAELAHTATNLRRLRWVEQAQHAVPNPWDTLAAAVAVAAPYVKGQGPAGAGELSERMNLPVEAVSRLLGGLCAGGIVCPVESTEGEAYIPARPPAAIAVADVLAISRPGSRRAGGDYDSDLTRAVEQVRSRTGAALEGLSLADIVGGRHQTREPATESPG